MADYECLEEFEEATPLQKRFCSQLSVEEYEQSAADSTEEALAQLIAHLDTNPQAYHKILQAKKDEEIGVFSYIKVHNTQTGTLWRFQKSPLCLKIVV